MKSEQEFDKPLDTPIIEQKKMVVNSPIINPHSLKVEGFRPKEISVDEQVTYTKIKSGGTYCSEHYFDKVVETKAGYTATCRDCEYGKFINPIIQTIKDGKVIERP